MSRFWVLILALARSLGALAVTVAAEPQTSDTNTNALPIDLATTLRLAGAQNLDVQIARQRLREALANRESAMEQFFPFLSPGVTYHRRDGVAQATPSGIISDAHFDSYSPGVTLGAQVAIGDAIYGSLVARQLVRASEHAVEATRQEVVLRSVKTYFDLGLAKAEAEVLREAVRTSEDYQRQLHAAVSSGIAFKGDELRVQSQTENYQLRVQQALEQQKITSAELARILHLHPAVELTPRQEELVPLALVETNTSFDGLVKQSMSLRPELKESASRVLAARTDRKAAVYGPAVPTLGAQVFGGALGGGPDSGPTHWGAEGDYLIGLSWRIGPGGLFDSGRIKSRDARLEVARLEETKLRDLIASQVVTELARVESLAAQVEISRRNLATAAEVLRLTRERKQFGVGIVLEDIQAQEAFTRARADYLKSVAQYNQAQYALLKVSGQLR